MTTGGVTVPAAALPPACVTAFARPGTSAATSGDASPGQSGARARWWSGPELAVSLLALVLAAALYMYAHKDEGRLTQSKERGAAIVAALERHRADRGDYPHSLDALVPAYLSGIEPPTWGLRRWKYERITRATPAPPIAAARGDSVFFMLSVAANDAGYPLLFYDVTTRRWVLNN